MIEVKRMPAAVTEKIVPTRALAANRSEKEKPHKDHNNALSTGFRVIRKRTSRNAEVAARMSQIYPGKETALPRFRGNAAEGRLFSARRQTAATPIDSTKRRRATG